MEKHMFGHRHFPFDHLRERLFDKGDLKYVVLDLLKEKPRHGYDIIRALADRFGGFYAPSPGAVYPTLQMLEDMGYVTAQAQDGKKVYTITEEGLAFLAERRQRVDDIRDRVGGRRGAAFWEELHEMRHELRDFAQMFKHHRRGRWISPEKIERIRAVVARAREEIEAIL